MGLGSGEPLVSSTLPERPPDLPEDHQGHNHISRQHVLPLPWEETALCPPAKERVSLSRSRRKSQGWHRWRLGEGRGLESAAGTPTHLPVLGSGRN